MVLVRVRVRVAAEAAGATPAGGTTAAAAFGSTGGAVFGSTGGVPPFFPPNNPFAFLAIPSGSATFFIISINPGAPGFFELPSAFFIPLLSKLLLIRGFMSIYPLRFSP